ncbi:hypothetical protein QUA40_25380 [Microcoleus sp. Pol11C3]|uniref:hypothetical protein n=1 Tax=Microcoleus sp. Pol11C3 TaxID=3055390 RepID=UPI002FD2812F
MIEFLLPGYLLVCSEGQRRGLWVQLVGYGARSPVGITFRDPKRRKAIQEDCRCTLQQNFFHRCGFL